MATLNSVITNTKTGQSYRFLQTAASTGGQLLEIESGFAPGSKEPPLHYHPAQDEEFFVLEGELTLKLGTAVSILKKGDRVQIPAGQPHAMWNTGTAKALVNWKTRPALDSELLFETFARLANDNKTDENGRPSLLQAALSLSYFSNVFRMAGPPRWVQGMVFTLLKPVARLRGYRPVHTRAD